MAIVDFAIHAYYAAVFFRRRAAPLLSHSPAALRRNRQWQDPAPRKDALVEAKLPS